MKNKIKLIAVISLNVLIFYSCKDSSGIDGISDKIPNKKASYIIGYDIGKNFHVQNIPLNSDNIMQGIEDALAGKDSKYTDQEKVQILDDFKNKLQQKQGMERASASEQNQKQEEDFLTQNKTQAGVIETESGLQYKVLKPGTGNMPTLTNKVTVHYEGRTLDGKVFDSSYTRDSPIDFTLNGVISGWTEVLQLMKQGAIYEVYIPSRLAYGQAGRRPDIGPNELLIFKIELLDVFNIY